MKTEWKVSDIENAKHVGIIEFKDNEEEWHSFTVMDTQYRLVFGGCCNIGFLESGYLEYKNEDECLEEALNELFYELLSYYNEGPESVERIVFNERM